MCSSRQRMLDAFHYNNPDKIPVVFGDDWGTQSAPIISPDLFREIYKPVYKKLGGGGIFNIEVENDSPFENVKMMLETIFDNRTL